MFILSKARSYVWFACLVLLHCINQAPLVSACDVHVFVDLEDNSYLYGIYLYAYDHNDLVCASGDNDNLCNILNWDSLTTLTCPDNQFWTKVSASKNGYTTVQLGLYNGQAGQFVFEPVSLCGAGLDTSHKCDDNQVFKAKCTDSNYYVLDRYENQWRMCPVVYNSDGSVEKDSNGYPTSNCGDSCSLSRRFLRGV